MKERNLEIVRNPKSRLSGNELCGKIKKETNLIKRIKRLEGLNSIGSLTF